MDSWRSLLTKQDAVRGQKCFVKKQELAPKTGRYQGILLLLELMNAR